jgi:uncharacterized membrane protein YebE (DUF533 family)
MAADWLDAYLGNKKNMRLTPLVKGAKYARMMTPWGAALGIGMLAGEKAWDWYQDSKGDAIEPTPAREDYLATLNNKFSDEELEEFRARTGKTYHSPEIKW